MSFRTVIPLVSALALIPSYAIAQTAPAPKVPAADILPADLPGLLLIDNSSRSQTALSRYSLFPANFNLLEQFLTLEPGVNFKQDVQPWLGDQVILAAMPASQSVVNYDPMVLVAPVKDSSQVGAFIEKIKTSRKKPALTRQYNGVTLLEWKGPEEEPVTSPPASPLPSPRPSGKSPSTTLRHFSRLLAQPGSVRPLSLLAQTTPKPISSPNPSTKPSLPAGAKPAPTPPTPQATPTPAPDDSLSEDIGLTIAVLPGYVVSATNAKPIEQLIDAQSSPTKLAQNPLFQRTLQSPQFNQSLATVYVNTAALSKMLESLPEDEAAGIPLPSREELKTSLAPLTRDYTAFDGYLWPDTNGLRFRGLSHYKTPKPENVKNLTIQKEQVFAYIPASTYLSTTSYNLAEQWRLVSKEFENDPILKEGLKEFRSFFKTMVGLDFDRDVLSWMDGEYGFFLFPAKEGLFPYFEPSFKMGLGLTIKTSKRPIAENTIKKVEQFAKKSGDGLAIASRPVKNQATTSWEVKDKKATRSILAYSWVEPDTFLITTGAAPMGDLLPKPYLNLSQSSTFKTATAPFARPNSGYFYLNVGSLLSFIYGFIPPDENSAEIREFKRAIGTIRSFSASALIQPEREEVDALLVLATQRKP